MANTASEAELLATSGASFSFGYRTWFLGLMVAIYACSFIDRIILNTIGPAIIKELRLSDLEFGLLGGMAFAVFYSAFGIPIAWVAERRSRITVVSVCIALWSVMTALCGVAQGYGQLLLFRMGVGVGEAGSGPATHSLISDLYPPKKRASALAIYSVGVPLGIMFGAIAGGWIAQTFSWRTALVVVGLPGLALALLARLTLKEPPRGRLEPTAVPGAAPPLRAVLGRLFSRPTFINLCAGCILTNLTTSGINTFAATFLARSFHLGLATVGLMYGLISGGAGLAGYLLGGFGSDQGARRDVRWYVLLPAFGSITALPIFLVALSRDSAAVSGVLLFVAILLSQIYFAPTFGVVQNLVEPRMRASAAAFVLLLMNIFGQGLGPTLIGFLSDTFAKRLFVQGDYVAICRAHGAHAAASAACGHASATGLTWAMMAFCVFLAWGSLHYVLASRTIARDLDRA